MRLTAIVSTLTAIALQFAAGYALVLAIGSSDALPTPVTLALAATIVPICRVLAVAVHEAGHAIGGICVGLVPRTVTLGQGRPLIVLKAGRTWLVLRRWPFCGCAAGVPTERRWAYAVVVVAGPFGNILTLACLVASLWLVDGLRGWLLVFGIGQGACALFALVPGKARFLGEDLLTDGSQLYRLILHRSALDLADERAAMLARFAPPDAGPPPATPSTAEILYQLRRIEPWTESWAYRDMTSSLRSLLEGAALTATERAYVQSFLIARAVLCDDREIPTALLSNWSREALASRPCATTRIGRGAVLVEEGAVDEGRAMLLEGEAMLKADGFPDHGESWVCGIALGRAAEAIRREHIGRGDYALATEARHSAALRYSAVRDAAGMRGPWVAEAVSRTANFRDSLGPTGLDTGQHRRAEVKAGGAAPATVAGPPVP